MTSKNTTQKPLKETKNVPKISKVLSDLQCVQHHGVPVQTVAQQASFLSSQAVFNSLIEPTVLTEQLNQLHVYICISWSCRQLSLKEVKQLVPALLALTTQKTLLNRDKQTKCGVYFLLLITAGSCW